MPTGDSNQNGVVDAADYVVWRKGLGMTYTQLDFDVWRANCGRAPSAGWSIGSGVVGYGHGDSGPGVSAVPL